MGLGGRSLGLGRGSRRARGQRRGGWAAGTAGRMGGRRPGVGVSLKAGRRAAARCVWAARFGVEGLTSFWDAIVRVGDGVGGGSEVDEGLSFCASWGGYVRSAG